MRDGDVSVRLRDILRAIAGIQETVGGLGLANYSTVWAVNHAPERGIEIISEASRHIPERMKREEPAIPWRQIADVGNVLRHGYQTISDHVIWDVIVTHLDPLDAAIRRILRRIESSPDLAEQDK